MKNSDEIKDLIKQVRKDAALLETISKEGGFPEDDAAVVAELEAAAGTLRRQADECEAAIPLAETAEHLRYLMSDAMSRCWHIGTPGKRALETAAANLENKVAEIVALLLDEPEEKQ